MLHWRSLVFLYCNVTCCRLFSADFPALVVKANGLAAGKGVVVATTKEEACLAARDMLQVLYLLVSVCYSVPVFESYKQRNCYLLGY